MLKSWATPPRRRSQSTSATRASRERAAVSARLAAVSETPSPRIALVTATITPPWMASPRSDRMCRSRCSRMRYCSAAALIGAVSATSRSSTVVSAAAPPSMRSRNGPRFSTALGMLDIAPLLWIRLVVPRLRLCLDRKQRHRAHAAQLGHAGEHRQRQRASHLALGPQRAVRQLLPDRHRDPQRERAEQREQQRLLPVRAGGDRRGLRALQHAELAGRALLLQVRRDLRFRLLRDQLPHLGLEHVRIAGQLDLLRRHQRRAGDLLFYDRLPYRQLG